jgi:NitT/TauT family transport system permease protein
MIKTDKIRKPQPVLFYIIDYLWSGFTGLSVAMIVVALWAWGSAIFGEFMLPAPADVFQKALDLLKHFQQNEIGISLWRSVVGIGIALIVGLTVGLIAGSFKTAMALLKPVITILLAMPPIIWVVMALFWFGFGNPSVLFTIIVLVAPLTFASAAMGMASVNKQHEELFDAYKLGLWKKIRYLYVPHLTGYVISSIGVAVAMGVKVVIMAELISGAKRGFFDKIKNVFSSGNDFADNTVLELRPQGEISAFSKKMNESFNTDATAMLESKIAQERTFELDVTNGLINKQRFDPRRVDVSAKVGSVERWIINSSLPVGFTIQGAKFVIESQDDVNVDVSELAWKDTVWVKKKVQILVKFEQPSSNTHPFLFGSSNLMLADMGCLGIMIVQ